MTQQANLTLMKRAVDAFVKGDMAALSTMFAPDVVWHVPGRHMLAKDYRGRDEVFGFFGRLMEETGGSFRLEPIEALAGESGGIYVDRVRAERKGRSLDILLLLRVTISDGRITEGWDCFHQEHLLEEFMA
jgi:ketosteroid isomerase-like protein